MKNQNKSQTFKAVEFMRKQRDKLSELYNNNPKEYKRQLEEIRKKYKGKFHQKETHPV